MIEDEKAIEKVVLTRLLRLNATILGLVIGFVMGTMIFVATNWLVLKGGSVVGPHLSLLNQFYVGYEVSFVGSLIGFAYGMVTGFTIGYVVARIYNWIAEFREARHQK